MEFGSAHLLLEIFHRSLGALHGFEILFFLLESAVRFGSPHLLNHLLDLLLFVLSFCACCLVSRCRHGALPSVCTFSGSFFCLSSSSPPALSYRHSLLP